MGLEKTIKKIGAYGKQIIFGGFLIGSLAFSNCPFPPRHIEKIPIETPTIPEEQKGAVMGRVVVPVIENNQIVYKGYNDETNRKAYVEIKELNHKRVDGILTSCGGNYFMDEILKGIYLIEAREAMICVDMGDDSVYCTDPIPEVTYLPAMNLTEIEHQKTTHEEDLELRTNYERVGHIIYGKIYRNQGGTIPFSNKNLYLHEEGNFRYFSDLEYNAGERIGSLITSPDGSYAFYTWGRHVPQNPPFCLKAKKENVDNSWKIPIIKFKSTDKEILEYEINQPGPVKIDAYLSGYK